MISLYRIRAVLRWLLRRDDVEQALDRELADYIERSAAEKIRDGMSESEARRAARIEVGHVEQTKNRVRDKLSLGPLDTLVRDTRYALRAMSRQRAFTALVVLCLALGIGANTTIFSFMESILFRSLPVAEPGELVVLQWTALPPREGATLGIRNPGGAVDFHGRIRGERWPYPFFEQLRERQNLFSSVFGHATALQLAIDDGRGPAADGLYVTGNFFGSLGIEAQAGRLLSADDDRFDAPPAIVLSAAFGAERFGSAETAVGQIIRLNGVAFTVVGVTPAEFFGLDPGQSPAFYLPLRAGPLVVAATPGAALPVVVGNSPEMYQDATLYWVATWARLRPGVTREQVETMLRPPFEQFFADHAIDRDALRNTPRLIVASGAGGHDSLRMRYGETLIVLFAMVVLILIVACASIASLLLARATARRREMAVRMSVGAGRLGVIRQLLTESILLSLLGAVAGVLLSIVGTRLLAELLAAGDGARLDADLNGSVLAFTLAAALLTGVLFGLAPAVHATKVDLFPALKGSRSMPDVDTPRGRQRLRFGQMLVVAQIALALVLLVGASLFAATLSNLRTTELGFNPDRLLLARVDASRAGYGDDELKQFWGTLHDRLARLPGVDSSSFSWSVLAGGGTYLRPVTVAGTNVQDAFINVQIVGASFFETMQIDVLDGRAIADWEVETSAAVAVVDQSFAATYFPGVNPVGRTIDVVDEGTLRVVGVSANARHDRIRGDVRPVVYYTYTWDPHPLLNMVFELRTQGEPLRYADTLRRIVRDLNPEVIVDSIRTQAANTDSTINREILFARLSNAFALLALAIACLGLYGTVSYGMARRTPEIGLRMALGATRSGVLRLALRQVLGLGIAGLAIGVPTALIASRSIESFLWGVAPNDPTILAGAALAVLAAVAIAGYAPASRASNVDPIATLRTE